MTLLTTIVAGAVIGVLGYNRLILARRVETLQRLLAVETAAAGELATELRRCRNMRPLPWIGDMRAGQSFGDWLASQNINGA